MKPLIIALCFNVILFAPLRADDPAIDRQSSLLFKKTSYQKKAEDDLADLSMKIQGLRRQSEQAGADTRAKVNHQINLLEKDLKTAQKKLTKLEGQTAGGWEKFRVGLDKAIEDLKESYRKTASKFN